MGAQPPGYALAQDLKKTFPDRKKSDQLYRFCPVMLVTKKPDYYLLFSQVLLHPKLGF